MSALGLVLVVQGLGLDLHAQDSCMIASVVALICDFFNRYFFAAVGVRVGRSARSLKTRGDHESGIPNNIGNPMGIQW